MSELCISSRVIPKIKLRDDLADAERASSPEVMAVKTVKKSRTKSKKQHTDDPDAVLAPHTTRVEIKGEPDARLSDLPITDNQNPSEDSKATVAPVPKLANVKVCG